MVEVIVVCNCFITFRGELLFLESSKGFQLPGGKLDDLDLSPEECVKREVFEETGIKLQDLNLLGVDLVFDSIKQRKMLVVSYIFHISSVVDVKLSNEHLSFEWMNVKTALDSKLLPSLFDIVRRYSGEFD